MRIEPVLLVDQIDSLKSDLKQLQSDADKLFEKDPDSPDLPRIDRNVNDIKHMIERIPDFRTQRGLYADLAKKYEEAFVGLRVFTGGTLSNSSAESINNRLRHIGLCYDTHRIDAIIALREYSKVVSPSLISFSKERKVKLERIMMPDVMTNVSNGALKKQAQMMEDAMKTCVTEPKRMTKLLSGRRLRSSSTTNQTNSL